MSRNEQSQLDFLVGHLNYQTKIIDEYKTGARDRRFSPAQNAERLQELIGERDTLYQELCSLAKACGYEHLSYPAIPPWQRASDGSGLWLSYAPSPNKSLEPT